MYSTDLGVAAVVLRGRESESWGDPHLETWPSECSATQTHRGCHQWGESWAPLPRITQGTQAKKLGRAHLHWKVPLATMWRPHRRGLLGKGNSGL